MVDGEPTVYIANYALTDTLYAVPEYWDIATQAGTQQWGAQRLSAALFPSQKGLFAQRMVYGAGGPPGGAHAIVSSRPAAVAWFDGSASEEVYSKLRLGVPNAWHHGAVGGRTIFDGGSPVMDTRDGLRGRDR